MITVTPWECVEVPKFETPSDIGTPSPASWQIAMVDWAALNERESVWHYCNRANPVPFGCRDVGIPSRDPHWNWHILAL